MKVLVIKYKDLRIFGKFGGSRSIEILIPALFFDEKIKRKIEGLIKINTKQSIGINKPVTTAMIKNYIDELKQVTGNYRHHYRGFNIDYWNTIDKLISIQDNPLNPDEFIVLEIPGEDKYCYSDLLRDGIINMFKRSWSFPMNEEEIPTLIES